MRTTIELPDELRAKLLEIAARRGDKGFSVLVQEAVARYLADYERREERVREAVTSIGSLGEADTGDLEDSIRTLRARWR